jgi:hypothetical protein
VGGYSRNSRPWLVSFFNRSFLPVRAEPFNSYQQTKLLLTAWETFDCGSKRYQKSRYDHCCLSFARVCAWGRSRAYTY